MKIFLTLIVLLNCSVAYAKFDIRSMPIEKRNELFLKARKITPHGEQWFIAKNTLRCSSKKNLKKAYAVAINNNGILDTQYLSHLNCSTSPNRWSIGVVTEAPTNGSNIVQLLYEIGNMQTTWAYFYAPSLVSLEQRKKMNIY